MLYDVTLLVGCAFIVFGVLRMLSLMVDKNSPISGLAVAVIGIACLAWVHVETEGEITFDKVPDALFRVIGKLN